MDICRCNIEKYTGNLENDENILLCNICGKIDLRADDQSIQYHDDIDEIAELQPLNIQERYGTSRKTYSSSKNET